MQTLAKNFKDSVDHGTMTPMFAKQWRYNYYRSTAKLIQLNWQNEWFIDDEQLIDIMTGILVGQSKVSGDYISKLY